MKDSSSERSITQGSLHQVGRLEHRLGPSCRERLFEGGQQLAGLTDAATGDGDPLPRTLYAVVLGLGLGGDADELVRALRQRREIDGVDGPRSERRSRRVAGSASPSGADPMSARTIGIDLAKQVFQVHGVDDAGRPVLKKRLRRSEVRGFFAGLAPCLIGMEACASSHYWARELGTPAARAAL